MRKAQLEIMQHMFLLIFFIIIIVAGIMFYSLFVRTQETYQALDYDTMQQDELIHLILHLPHLRCNGIPSCIDMQKARLFTHMIEQDTIYYTSLLKTSVITLTTTDQIITLYDNPLHQPRTVFKTQLPIQVKDEEITRGVLYIEFHAP